MWLQKLQKLLNDLTDSTSKLRSISYDLEDQVTNLQLQIEAQAYREFAHTLHVHKDLFLDAGIDHDNEPYFIALDHPDSNPFYIKMFCFDRTTRTVTDLSKVVVVVYPDYYWIAELFTHKKSKGIGSAILNATISYATSKGIKKIKGALRPEDSDIGHPTRLHSYYSKFGFTIHEGGLIELLLS